MSNIFNYQYSIFGNFSKIISNIQKVANKFEGFRREVTNLINPIGQQQPLYAFGSSNIGLRITLDRIDFLFSELSDADIDKINHVIKDVFGTEYLENINRLAINYSIFNKNEYETKLHTLINNISLIQCSDCCREVNIRCNYKSSLDGIDLNNIVSIQNIIVQDSRSFESFPSILFSLDINTVVSQKIKFTVNDSISMFRKMKEMATKEMNELIEKIEG